MGADEEGREEKRIERAQQRAGAEIDILLLKGVQYLYLLVVAELSREEKATGIMKDHGL